MSSIKKIRTTEGDLSIDYNSLDNLPTIPSKVSDLTNDSGFITSSLLPTKVSDLTNDSGFIDNTVNNLVNYTTTSDLNTALNNIEDGLEEVDNKINGNDIAGDMVVESIRTKNMFDGTSLVLGSIAGTQFDKRISSRQALYLEPGTYTFSCNIASTYRFGLLIRPVPPPNNEDASFDSGWITDTSTYTFTIVTGGYFGVNLSRTDNEVFTTTDINNLLGYNYQLEKGDTASAYTNYQNLEPVFSKMNRYSNSEIRIGTWIDGKPIYRKVVAVMSIDSGANSCNVSHGISNLKEFVSIKGIAKITGTNEYRPISCIYVNNSGVINPDYAFNVYAITPSVITLSYGNWYKSRFDKAYITLEYTKTTD